MRESFFLFLFSFGIGRCFKRLFIVVLQPFESVSGIVVIKHSLNLNWVFVEVPESSASVICLDIMQMNVVTDACSKKGKELSNILWVWMDKGIRGQEAKLNYKRKIQLILQEGIRFCFYRLVICLRRTWILLEFLVHLPIIRICSILFKFFVHWDYQFLFYLLLGLLMDDRTRTLSL